MIGEQRLPTHGTHMAASTTTTLDKFLKTLYKNRPEDLVYNNTPLLGMLTQKQDFVGKDNSLFIPFRYGRPQGVSNTFANAQAGASSSVVDGFTLTRKRLYGFGTITRETAMAFKDGGSVGDFAAEAIQLEGDGTIRSCSETLHAQLWGNGGGSIGQVNSGTTGTSFTLKNRFDVNKFEIGMKLQFSAADGLSGAVKTGEATVTGVAVGTGVITVSAALSAIDGGTGPATNDHVFRSGTFGAAWLGIPAFIPTSAPSATAFLGVNRSVAPERLGGVRYDGSGAGSHRAAVLNGATELSLHSLPRPATHLFVHPNDYNILVQEQEAKVQQLQHAIMGGKVHISFESFVVHTPAGPLQAVGDFRCPEGYAYILSMDTWELHTMGPLMDWVDEDGSRVRALASEDGFEFRIASYGNLVCTAPGRNCVITLP